MGAKPPPKRVAKAPSLGSDSPHPNPLVPKGALLSGKKGTVHMVVKISDKNKVQIHLKHIKNY